MEDNEWTKRFDRGEWKRLPAKLKSRWFGETEYNSKEPSPQLVKDVEEAIGIQSKTRRSQTVIV